MRRLFSTFAHGLPGAGLLMLRVVAGTALTIQGVTALTHGPAIGMTALQVLAILAGILLLAGLWTPIAGVLVAVVAFLLALRQPGDPWIYILLGTLGAALALIGPGAWSVDARLFGWKRIDPSK
jgi:uncharacterized membrane protein YphA (DoxX/SURF4 family)